MTDENNNNIPPEFIEGIKRKLMNSVITDKDHEIGAKIFFTLDVCAHFWNRLPDFEGVMDEELMTPDDVYAIAETEVMEQYRESKF